jgi:hypothetical protein
VLTALYSPANNAKEIQKGLFCQSKDIGFPLSAGAESFDIKTAAPDKERKNDVIALQEVEDLWEV